MFVSTEQWQASTGVLHGFVTGSNQRRQQKQHRTIHNGCGLTAPTVLSNKFGNSAGFTPLTTKSQLARIGHFDVNNVNYINFLDILKLLECALLNNIN